MVTPSVGHARNREVLIDYDDEEERLVETEQSLVDDYVKAQREYQDAYNTAEGLKLVRDFYKSKLVAAMDSKTGTATVGGNRRLSVKISTSNRIDTTRLRAEAPDIARMYEKESTSSRIDVI